MRLFANASYPFMQWRRRAYLISGLLLLAGLAGMVRNVAQHGSWLNYGVDFAGGTLVQLRFNQPTSEQELRTAVRSAGFRGWDISRFGGGNEYVVRLPSGQFRQEAGVDASQRVTRALSGRYPATAFRIVRTEAVGPKVGDELQRKALLAILVSFAATLLYLAIRFEWRFGLAAIIATAHDILITLGFLAVIRSEISLGSVAAILTILGYSLNDTIVVFDRIRENLRKPSQGRSYLDLLNVSINETLSRTALTGSSALATLLALFFFGGAVIRDFALVLILGIVIGTFSSVFVAAPALYAIESRWPRSRPAARTGSSSSRTTARPTAAPARSAAR